MKLADLFARLSPLLPRNQFVAFVKPYLNLAAAAVAACLVAKANVLGFQGLDQDALAQGLTAGGVGALTWLGAHLGDMKWLKGVHLGIIGDAQVQVAALKQNALSPALAAAVAAENLPADAVELAAPPPDDPSPAAMTAALGDPTLDDPGPQPSPGQLAHSGLGDGDLPAFPPTTAARPPA